MSPVHPSRSSRCGTVGGDVEEVAAQPPDRVAVQLVEQVVGALEVPGAAQLGVHDDRLERVGGQLAGRLGGPAGDLGVAEAVEGLGRLEEVVAAAEHEPVGRVRGAQGPDAELAVLEDLGVAQGDLLTGLAADGEAQPADEVLAEVDQRPPGRRGPDLDGRRALVPHDGWPDVRRQPRDVEGHGPRRRPSLGSRPRPQPGVVAQPRVDGLAVVEVTSDQGHLDGL